MTEAEGRIIEFLRTSDTTRPPADLPFVARRRLGPSDEGEEGQDEGEFPEGCLEGSPRPGRSGRHGSLLFSRAVSEEARVEL
jgi:hypothetical protein